ncbi:SH3 domain-containing protein [uncultured Helicobacter sp.]|uniref:SH3 domain-containing protein n=1 Tax=uncultured Helicobacter sp. TaxID=175537 RepID=UPI0026217AE3|nr:SH3 domain-containing protein [uncultured Helicobacter sp.]
MRIIFVFLCVFGFFAGAFAEETRLFPKAQEEFIPSQTPKNLESTNTETLDSNTTVPQSPLPNVILENEAESENVESKNTESTQDFTAQEIPLNNSLVKNVYLEALTPLMDILYVNQVVALEFKMLVFTQYSTITTEFIFEDTALKDSVEVLNPNEAWVLNAEDSSFKNTFYLKIKQAQFAIPKIKVNVLTDNGLISESLAGSSARAIKLERQGEYSQVLAQDLQILDTKITNYDSTQNLAVFQLQSTMANLFDFHLANYKQQGIESKSGDYKQAVAFYYVIVPKAQNTISFDYFNTLTSKYQTLQVPNIAVEDRVSTQSDIKPKNNYQFFQISLMIFFAILFFGLYLYKRKIIFVLLGIFSLALLLYFSTLKSEVTIKANVALKILPTFNSTIVLTTQSPTKAEILGERNPYYKVILEDERIGWVKKDDLQN